MILIVFHDLVDLIMFFFSCKVSEGGRSDYELFFSDFLTLTVRELCELQKIVNGKAILGVYCEIPEI